MFQLICAINISSQHKTIVTLLFLFTLLPIAHFTKCPTEYSVISGTKIKARWASEEIDNQIVISNPPCLNNSSKLITRVCSNGLWYPAITPICDKFSNENTCPDNFQKIANFCVDVTESGMWSNNALKSQHSNHSANYWLPVRRTVKFGDFEYVEVGTNYGNIISIEIDDFKEYYQGDCLLYDVQASKIKVENCSPRFVKYFERSAPLYDCPKNCMATNSDYKCFCKSQTCRNLARVETFNDKKVLDDLVGNELCRISGVDHKSHSYLNGSLWQVGNPPTSCYICQDKVEDPTRTRMVLTFEEKKKRLYLLVYSPEGIKQFEDELLIFCFTNAGKLKMKEKCDVDPVHKEFGSVNYPGSFFVYEVEIKKYMGEYWCEAFSPKHSLLKSERVIAYEKKRGNEYALRLIIDDVCKIYSCNLEDFFKKLTKGVLKKMFERFNPEIRIMEVFNFDTYNDIVDVLVHVSTGKNLDISMEYELMLLKLKNHNHKNIKVEFFRSSEFCLPEELLLQKTNLHWPLTKIHNVVISEEFCLFKNGSPITRQCEGSFLYGAIWSNVTGRCVENPQVSKLTKQLKDMARSKNTFSENVWDWIGNQTLNLLDIYYLNIILSKLPETDHHAFDFINKLMVTERTVLTKCQKQLNLTDGILETLENIVTNASLSPESVYLVRRDNLLVHVTNPFLSNISGLLLYRDKELSLSDCLVRDFNRGDSFGDVDQRNLELGVYVPEPILEQLLNETNNTVSDIFVITVVFYNDNFFVDDNYRSGSLVVSVSIPGYGSYLKAPIPIIFNSKNHNSSNVCGFWDHGKTMNRKKGEWSVLGGNHAQLNNFLHVCSFVHLTHFALLLMSDKKIEVDEVVVVEDYNDYYLEIITNVGSSLSMFGIFGIFTTAVVYKKWRSKIGTKILLNLSVAILFELICIHLSEIRSIKKEGIVCKIIGMVLHYVVLSKFFWMLIYAFLQYYRFVKVLGTIPKNLIIKSVIVGWGVPLVFISLLGFFPAEYYISNTYELCYPRGILLQLTVIAPVSVIMLANMLIFCLVMYNVTYKMNSCGSKKLFRLRLYLALLLFSVLGVPWLFGLVAELLEVSIFKIILFYMFCITATLQGFVLFLFYVVLNSETREFWTRTLVC